MLLVLALGWTRRAGAQLHWDASVQAGATKRFLSSRPSGGRDAGVGPAAQIAAHVALLPLVRVGGYASYDLSPGPGDAGARDVFTGGLRAKVLSPWPRGSFRTWALVGIGYARTHARGYDTRIDVPAGPRDATVEGADGGFVEVPVGIGASYKLRKPLELTAELGFRIGFAHHGDAYRSPGPALTIHDVPPGSGTMLPPGIDRFALGLTVGVLFEL